MKSGPNDWAGLNADLRKALSYHSPEISRITIYEYKISIGIDGLELCSNTAIELRESGIISFEIVADYRNRSTDSYAICKIIGEKVLNCICDDAGIHVYLEGDRELVFRRDDIFENCTIGSKEIGLVVI